ncbi:MAG: hypothetical protein FWF77_03250 [Defluviitaleaceae bacterium]|nr:hypothetical protein [Defluviitaleaceae bacterium]
MLAAAHSLEAGGSFLPHEKKESASDTRRLIFFGTENCSRLRENVSPPTHVSGAHRALGALFKILP